MSDGLAVLADEPLAAHTAHRTGGRCDVFVVVHREEALRGVLADCRAVSWRTSYLGAGTRTVVKDGGMAGAVIRLGVDFARCEAVGDGCWRVGAAVPVPALLARAGADETGGTEALHTVAGSCGASWVLDEGWDELVQTVRFVHRGRVKEGELGEVRSGRRLVVGATVRFPSGRRRVSLLRTLRRKLIGSWYEVPGRRSARHEIAASELEQVRLRRVTIPGSAPELMVNLGGGSAADMALLHRSAIERVRRRRALDVKSGVRWAGTT